MRQLPRTSVVPRSGEPATFVEVVRERAQQAPDAETFTFLETGEMAGSRQVLCNAALERRARAIGARLQSLGLAGERALLVYAPGLHYVEGFLGCLFGGVIAVPVYPPDPRRLARTLPRLQAVVRDARAAAVLTTSDLAAVGDASTSIAPDLASLRWVHSDLVDPGEADAWRAPSIGPDSLAFLQYTSGSTAEPRGVMLTHQNLLHNSRLIRARFAVREGSRAVIWLPPYHDMGLIGGILQPLVSGVRVVLMSPLAMLERPMRWLEAMAETRAAISGGPNFGYELCVRKSTPEERARLDLRSWRVAFNGADVVRPETIERFARAFEVAGFQRRAFLPCYGLAEATLLVTAGEVGAGPRTASAPDGRLVAGCGRVVGDQQVLILDPGRDQPLPAGEIGEICVRGPSVAAGYWNCPEDTARTFARSGGSLLLRTGDLGFLSVHGELYVRGRRKDLLILRGRNHYPQDIEFTVERSHPALRKGGGAAFSVEVDGQERLVVVHEIDPRRPAEPEAVAEAIRRDIGQDHDIPVHTIALVRPSSVPKTSSGKVRRRASKAAFLAGELEVVASRSFAAEDAEPAAPVSVARLRALEPQERRRALTAWIRQEVATQLGVTAAELDETTPVRMLGLDSIAAMEVAHALETHAGIRLPITNLLGDLAIVDVARKAADAFDETASTDDRPHTREGLAPSAGEVAEVALSEGQAALWFLHALAPGSSAYHVPCALHLRSELDVDALRRAFDLLHERHALLRSSVVPLEGVPRLRVEEHGRASFSVVDVGGLSDAELASRVDAAARRPFDLRRGPLLRVWLFRRAADDAVLLLVAHHLVVDLWSMVVLLRELGIAYGALRRGAEVALPSPAASYADFVRWQRELLAGPAAERALAHFRVALTRAPATLNLPTDAPRPPVQGFRGNAVRFALDRGLIDRLRALARGNGATLYAVLLAAWGAVLARHAGQDRVVVGVPTNGRPGAAFEDVVGYFVNPLPVCVDLSGDPRFADELVGRVREALVAMLEHQHHPFSRLVEALQSGRDASRSPIFQTMLVLERPQARGIDREAVSHFVLGGPGPRAQFGGLPADPYPVKTSGSQLDVSLTLVETEDGLVAALDYDTDLFDASTAEGLAKRFGVFLRAAVERPTAALSELAVLDAAERRLLLEAWSGAGAAPPGAPRAVQEAFERQVDRTPDAPAVSHQGRRLTYRALDQQANRLAHRLRRLGVGPDSLVVVALERSIEAVVALFGVLKAGGAYVPLDLAQPLGRLVRVVADTGARVLVASEALAKNLSACDPDLVAADDRFAAVTGEPDDRPPQSHHPRQLAYVIYTSGSTGTPKGVAVEHRSLATYVEAAAEAFAISPGDRVLQFASLSFDTSAEEVFVSLTRGAELVLRTDEMLASPAGFLRACEQAGVTVLDLPTAYWHELVEACAVEELPLPPGVRLVVIGGERARVDRTGRWLATTPPGVRLLNTYGPTEATIGATMHELRLQDARGPEVPIGRPVAGTGVYVLDEALRPVPAGVRGELYLSGIGLARGYLNHPDITAERFLPDPYNPRPGARMYRTGDVVRFRPDGNLEFLGRTDHQVKIRGFRIELGEIEAVLRQHPDIGEAVVVAHPDPTGERRLFAYVVAADRTSPTDQQLRAFLRQRLPEYMLPAAVELLQALPLTPSGKVDRKALPAPSLEGRSLQPPRGPVEELIAGIWAEVLGVERVGAHDNFFDLGGHSLRATQVVSRLRRAAGVELGVRTLFTAPTVAELAREVATAGWVAAQEPTPSRPGHHASPPLSFGQQRIWFLERQQPGGSFFNCLCPLRFRGRLDNCALRQALDEIVRRHEILRTSYAEVDGRPVQRIADPMTVPTRVVDLRDLDGQAREDGLRVVLAEETERPFPLDTPPMVRAVQVEMGEEDHILVLTMHHIVTDDWTDGVLAQELAALYRAFAGGEPSPLPEPSMQYADFAAWQRRWLSGDALTAQLDWWRRRLEGARLDSDPPPDRVPPNPPTCRGGTSLAVVQPMTADAVRRLARRHGATPFMTLLTAFDVLLHAESGSTDVCVESPTANRTRVETESLVGYLVNPVLLRTDLSGDPTLSELLGRVKESCLESFARQEVPFPMIVDLLRERRDLDRDPTAKFVLENAPFPGLRLPHVDVEVIELECARQVRNRYVVVIAETTDSFKVDLSFNTDLISPEHARRALAAYQRLLVRMTQGDDPRLSQLVGAVTVDS